MNLVDDVTMDMSSRIASVLFPMGMIAGQIVVPVFDLHGILYRQRTPRE